MTIPAGQLRLQLTLLALPGNETVGVDTLVGQLWPERPPVRARDTVHVYVGRLRKLLGPDLIGTQSGAGYQLNVVADALDLHRFHSSRLASLALDTVPRAGTTARQRRGRGGKSPRFN